METASEFTLKITGESCWLEKLQVFLKPSENHVFFFFKKTKVSKNPEASRFYLVNKDFFVSNDGLTNVNIF